VEKWSFFNKIHAVCNVADVRTLVLYIRRVCSTQKHTAIKHIKTMQ